MKFRRTELDIAPGLVDLLFSLLGVSLLILSAFAMRTINSSMIPSQVSIGIVAANSIRSEGEIVAAESPSVGVVPYGCVIVRIQGFGIVYSSPKAAFVKDSTDCRKEQYFRKNDERSLENQKVVSSQWRRKNGFLWSRVTTIPVAIKAGTKVIIELQEYDFRAVGSSVSVSDSTFYNEVYLIDAPISSLADPTVVTQSNHVLNLPYSLDVVAGIKGIDEQNHRYQIYFGCISPNVQPRSRLKWVLLADSKGELFVKVEPKCADRIST